MKTVLAIAGVDPSGGAGLCADIETITVNGAYAMCAVTALTIQNTVGVFGAEATDARTLSRQIEAVCEDIPPDAVKIGMIANAEQADVIASCLRRFSPPRIVLDPVLRASTGAALSGADTVREMKRQLFPLLDVITPNLSEAAALTGKPCETPAQMEDAARRLCESFGCAVIVKGGHLTDSADDLLRAGEENIWLRGKRIAAKNTHGTGCTFSSALAVFLARGFALPQAALKAKEYVAGALAAGLSLGHGSGPVARNFPQAGQERIQDEQISHTD